MAVIFRNIRNVPQYFHGRPDAGWVGNCSKLSARIVVEIRKAHRKGMHPFLLDFRRRECGSIKRSLHCSVLHASY